VSQVITCPNCDKKLALRDELKGRALVCPQCNGRFTAPADEPQTVADLFGTTSDETPSANGSDMAFLDNLGPASAPAAAKTAAKALAPARRGAAARPSAAKTAFSSVPNAARAAAIRAKKKNAPRTMLYLGGGAAATVLVAVVMFSSRGGTSSSGGGANRGDENMRFGLTESQRKHLFEALFHAVDENGPNKLCRDEWRRLGREKNLTDQEISDVLKEGMELGWPQPAIAATMDQRQKTNRQEWIRTMNETNREPIMSP
jgi:hypothetical protein